MPINAMHATMLQQGVG